MSDVTITITHYTISYIKYIWDLENNWPPISTLRFFFLSANELFYVLNLICSGGTTVLPTCGAWGSHGPESKWRLSQALAVGSWVCVFLSHWSFSSRRHLGRALILWNSPALLRLWWHVSVEHLAQNSCPQIWISFPSFIRCKRTQWDVLVKTWNTLNFDFLVDLGFSQACGPFTTL